MEYLYHTTAKAQGPLWKRVRKIQRARGWKGQDQNNGKYDMIPEDQVIPAGLGLHSLILALAPLVILCVPPLTVRAALGYVNKT